MSTPDPRLSRRDAERLLDAPAEHDSALGQALTAASAPAHPRELRGEDTAAAAFQAARLSPAPASRSGYVSPSRLGSRAAARAVVATGAVVALTSGGFALASSTDLPGLPNLPGLPGLPALPGQASDRASDSTADAPRGAAGSITSTDSGSGSTDGSPSGSASGSPGAPGSNGSSTATGSPGSPSATSSATTPSETPSATSDGPATPSPSYEGLCRAFQAADRSDAGSSLDSAAFLALATQAGGADRIATYCIDLIGPPKPTGTPTPSPVKPTPSPGKPTPSPGKPTPSPGKPTDQPTNGNQGNQNNAGNNNSGSQNSSSTNQPNPNSQTNNGNGTATDNGNGNGPGKSGSSSSPSPTTTPTTPTTPASPATSPTGPGS